jgi:hypothetical protein
MSKLSLQWPDYLHDTIRDLAKQENISINQFITLALAEKVSALMTEDYLKARAARGRKAKFEAAMSNVADVEPLEKDRL